MVKLQKRPAYSVALLLTVHFRVPREVEAASGGQASTEDRRLSLESCKT